MTEPEFKAMKSVYSFCFPEVYDALNEFNSLPWEAYAVTGDHKVVQEEIDLHFKDLTLPSTDDGKIALDKLTEIILPMIRDIYSPNIEGLEEFPYMYYTPGSGPAITPIMLEHKRLGCDSINFWGGEYEGFRHHAYEAQISTNDRDAKAPVYWITNPASQNGNYFPMEFLYGSNEVLQENKFVFDLSYFGQSKPQTITLKHENIRAVILSMSKPYGVFRYRMGGFTFSKSIIPGLYSTKWEADPLRLLQCLYLLRKIPLWLLYERYNKMQKDIVHHINETFDFRFEPSDNLLTAFMHRAHDRFIAKRRLKLIKDYMRGDWYRICLTPYYEG